MGDNRNKKSHKQYNTSTIYSRKNNELRNLSTALGSQNNLENKMLDLKKSIGSYSRRNTDRDYNLKSRPVSARRGTPTGWLSTQIENGRAVKVFQSQIYLQAPDGQVLPKRGLSGSMVRKSSAISVSSAPATRDSFVSELKEVMSVPLSSRALGLGLIPRLSGKSKRVLLREDGSEVSSSYSWNSSDQGQRLQRERSQLNLCRALRANTSGVGSTHMNPMYCLYGSGLNLLNRHCAGGEEVEKSQDMVAVKRAVALEVKKLSLKCNSRTSDSKLQTFKSESEVKDVQKVKKSNVTDLDSRCSSEDAELKLSEIHQETESDDIHQEEESDEISPETGYNEIHQETEPSDTCQVTESTTDKHQENDTSEIYLSII